MEDYQTAEEVTAGSAVGRVVAGSPGPGWASGLRMDVGGGSFPRELTAPSAGRALRGDPWPAPGVVTLSEGRGAPRGSSGLAGSTLAAPRTTPHAGPVQTPSAAGPLHTTGPAPGRLGAGSDVPCSFHSVVQTPTLKKVLHVRGVRRIEDCLFLCLLIVFSRGTP